MKTRIATFNVENLFSRPRAMNEPKWETGQPYLDDSARLTTLLNHETYSTKDKAEILELIQKNGLDATRPNNRYLELKKIRGKLLERKNGNVTITATGRGDWLGWVELKREAISDAAMTNTARVIAEVNPEILVMVEVEDRPALIHFHSEVLKPMLKSMNLPPYEHLMVIDGNDERGIDVGIISREPILRMCSHVDDVTGGSHTFSRDCPEYYLARNGGQEIVVLPNHFASKGSDKTGKRRRVQAEAVKAIYEHIREKYDYVIVAGDFNDFPAPNGPLSPLLEKTDLKDAMSLTEIYKGLPGTYMHATAKEKIDYLLLSPELVKCVTAVDVNRRGFYAPTKWESFENINKKTKDRNQASDHHCVWADLEF